MWYTKQIQLAHKNKKETLKWYLKIKWHFLTHRH